MRTLFHVDYDTLMVDKIQVPEPTSGYAAGFPEKGGFFDTLEMAADYVWREVKSRTKKIVKLDVTEVDFVI